MPIDFAKLEKDLTNAVVAAWGAAAADDEKMRERAVADGGSREGALLDGGTCNFDSAMLPLMRGVTEAQMSAAAAKVGITAYKSSSKLRKGFILGVPIGAQANRRTVQARAMSESLRAAGWESSVWYAVD